MGKESKEWIYTKPIHFVLHLKNLHNVVNQLNSNNNFLKNLKELHEVMDVLIILIMTIIPQCISSHHIVYFYKCNCIC